MIADRKYQGFSAQRCSLQARGQNLGPANCEAQVLPRANLAKKVSVSLRLSWMAGILTSTLIALTLVVDASAQESNTSVGLLPLDVEGMRAELNRLGQICDRLQLKKESELCQSWLPTERADQQLFYLPVAHETAVASDVNRASWAKYFETARKRHAQFWFSEAKKQCEADDEELAYRLLFRTLREDPEHAEAKRVLGRLASSPNVKPQVRRSSAPHPDLGWPGSTFTRVESPHFLLTSRASNAETIQLAVRLEEYYALWSQFFYALWCAPGDLRKKLDGKVAPLEKQRQIRVVYLKDRRDYVQTLGLREENISVSVGYYDPTAKTSYFYPDENLEATFFHELTHQLLAEASELNVDSADAETAKRTDFWLIEGIATYMESLFSHENYWTLGGWESPRLQVARYRAVRDGYFMPWSEFHNGTMESWKANRDIALLYSQGAGISHYMLDGFGLPAESKEARQERRQNYIQSLASAYTPKPDSTSILEALGGEKAQEQYEKALTVSDVQLQQLRPARKLKELVLTGSELSSESWNALATQADLEWLDVSFSNATSVDLTWIAKLKSLQRLSVEGTLVDGQILDACQHLRELEELDLTGCQISDEDLLKLRKHPRLTTLWLGKTQVTNKALDLLDSIPKLTFVDVQGSGISPAAWQQFVEKHPQFKTK